MTKIEWKKYPPLCFWPKLEELWAKSEIGRFKSAKIGKTHQGIKVGPKATDYEYMISFWKFQTETYFLGPFVGLFCDLDGLQNQKILVFADFSLETQKRP